MSHLFELIGSALIFGILAAAMLGNPALALPIAGALVALSLTDRL